MTDKTDTRQFQPWPSIVCPHCGLSVKLPEGFDEMRPAILSTNAAEGLMLSDSEGIRVSVRGSLARILADVARWEYECGGCLTHVTVYAECAVSKPAAEEAEIGAT